jgi:hypothetical protein
MCIEMVVHIRSHFFKQGLLLVASYYVQQSRMYGYRYSTYYYNWAAIGSE